MFGNPNISATPVDDLYASQADVYGNSFANPMNPANMNPGWGIDPSLLSPSYTSSFRPQYGGPNGATPYGRQGFFSGVNNIMPWTNTPGWANPIDHTQASIDSVASRPIDGGMWFAQNALMPYAMIRGAGKLWGGYNAFGMGRNAYSMGKNFGRGVGTGIARGVGASSTGFLARGLSSTMGFTFGAAAGWALPLATAQAGFYAGEKAIFDPYINTRRSAENLRENFAGVTFGDSMGNSVTGGGLGGYESSSIARRITRDGIQDMSLSTGQYAQVADMVGRVGLADNVNSKDLAKRIKDSAEQMKLIMSIAAMPEMKDAIEQLAKLQKMGANVTGGAYSDAAGAMRQLGGLAAVAGTNVQRMMNTVGAQGQYLYQANGMTPYLGQIAAANNYAAFSAGSRMGLISSAQLARLGGLDGATQASLTGQLNASQSLYNKISSFNQYMGGGQKGEVIANLNQFGSSMVNNPNGTYGSMLMYGNQMAANRMSERGSLALDDQLYEILKNVPGMVGPNGKIAYEKAVPYMNQMGMSNDQIMAYGSQRISEQDEGAYRLNLKALNRNMIEQQQQLVEQNNFYAGVIGRNVYRAKRFGRNVTEGLGDTLGGAVASAEGSARDAVGSGWNYLWFNDTIKSSGVTVEEGLNGAAAPKEQILKFDEWSRPYESNKNLSSEERTRRDRNRTYSKQIVSKLNKALDAGDLDAKAYFKGKTSEERMEAMDRMVNSGKFGRVLNHFLSDPTTYKNIDKEIQSYAREKPEEEGFFSKLFKSEPEKVVNIRSKMEEELGLTDSDPMNNMRLVGRAYNAATTGEALTTSNIRGRLKSDANLQAIAKSRGITDPQDLLAYIQKASRWAIDNKVVGITTNSLRVNGSGIDGVKAAAAPNGGFLYDQNAIETKHLTYEDSLKASMAAAQDNKMRADLLNRYKSGRLDFSGMKESLNALDNAKTVEKFSDAVDKFSKSVDQQSGDSGVQQGNLFSSITNSSLFRQKIIK